MDDDDLKPKAGSPLSLLVHEDLSEHGVEELQERITMLKKEIRRAEDVLQKKHGSRAAADAVFTKS